jgi:hypothetical protein
MESEVVGKKFGMLTVIKVIRRFMPIAKRTRPYFVCVCECGKEVITMAKNVKSGSTVSCGCYGSALRPVLGKTHGMAKTKVYAVWRAMKSRCLCKSNLFYKDYGGRGITLDPAWRKFENFYADMGEKPEGMSIERIDNDGPYNKSNCKWATMKEQGSNRRANKIIAVCGIIQCISAWGEFLGIPKSTIHGRLRRGDTPAQALGIKVYGQASW